MYNTAQLWNQLVDVGDNRLTGEVFIWDNQMNGLWLRDVYALFCNYGFDEVFLENEKKKKKINICIWRMCAHMV